MKFHRPAPGRAASDAHATRDSPKLSGFHRQPQAYAGTGATIFPRWRRRR